MLPTHTCTHGYIHTHAYTQRKKRASFQDWRKLGTKGLGKEPVYIYMSNTMWC